MDCGTGLDGAYNATTNTTLAGGTYNFTTFTIASGVTVNVTGTDTLIIFCTGAVDIQGTLSANGGDGTPGVTFNGAGTGGVGVAGGYNGGNGIYSTSQGQLLGGAGQGPGGGSGGNGWTGGGGGGHATPGDTAGALGGEGGIAYGNINLVPTYGGSGGGGGSGGFNCGSGGGGAGGGIIFLTTCSSLTIGANGTISVNGGNGGSDGAGNCGGGGGGAGGSLWIKADVLNNQGNLSAIGGTGGSSTAGTQYQSTGANGGTGRIRLNYTTAQNLGNVTPAAGVSGSFSPVNLTLTGADIDCFGDSSGSANVLPSGGTTPYSYSWSSGATTATVSNLIAGTYQVTVTDSNGCTRSDSITLSQTATPVTATVTWTDVTCHGGTDGTASVTASGGVPGYTYQWTPGGSTDTSLVGLAGGDYLVTVTDSLGCTATDTAFVTEPQSGLSISFAVTPVSCFGDTNGSVMANVAGGTPGYTYLWAPGGSTDSGLSGLTGGTYSLTVTDTVGCVFTDSTVVNAPQAPLSASLTSTDDTGTNDGTASAAPSGGTPPYTYLWSNAGTTATISGLAAGTYSVTVTDSSGCTFSDSVIVNLTIGTEEELQEGLAIYPNPASDQVHLRLLSGDFEGGKVSLFSPLGSQVLVMDLGQGKEKQLSVSGLASGIYWLRIEVKDNVVMRKLQIE